MDRKTKQNEQTQKVNSKVLFPDEMNRNTDVNNKINKDTSEKNNRVSFADRGDSNNKALIQNPTRFDKKVNANIKSNRVTIRLVDSHEKEAKIKETEVVDLQNLQKKTDATIDNKIQLPDHGDSIGKATIQRRSDKSVKRLYENIKTNDICHERAVEKIGVRKKDTEDVVINVQKQIRGKPKIKVEDNVQNRVTIENGDDFKPVNVVNKVKNEKKSADVAYKKNTFASVDKADSKKVDVANVEVSKYDLRKRIRDKYTVKLKNNSQEENRAGEVTSANRLNRTDHSTQHQKCAKDPEQTKTQQPEKETEETKRKPVIKTVKSQNSPAVYKAVTFVRKGPSRVLQINIPTEKQKASKCSTETVPVKIKTKNSRVSVKESKERAKTRNKHVLYKRPRKIYKMRRDVSPERCISTESPITEVAKWAPSCVNRHTKPYYEAWVNTTLAAISRSSKKNKLFMEKKSILESFQRALDQGPPSPELVYGDFSDERYTGKIRVIKR